MLSLSLHDRAKERRVTKKTTMRNQILISVLVLLANVLNGQELPEKISETDFSIGKAIGIQSLTLNEKRELNIYLPASYAADTSKRYPVIYLLDGSKDEDFVHISGIIQFGAFKWINMNPECIVVGIENVDRKRDFTYPSQNKLDQEEFPTSGKSARFIRFLANELQPFVDANFRTTANKTIIGQSLGGLVATEVLLEMPDLFDNYIIVSPSLWWNDESLLSRQPEPFDSIKSIYIAVGKEGETMERLAKELFRKLSDQNSQNTELHYEFLEDKTHGDALHIAVYNALGKIFRSKNE
ncbi:alpha/beta hydrolase-fold protein [Gaetbulibacter sp. M240]|uniref:alpha/beta hydrolase n=1 Tax=Gaetbulibacter sp. M240 TaxID=3126511 RepID=UPI00374E2DDD